MTQWTLPSWTAAFGSSSRYPPREIEKLIRILFHSLSDEAIHCFIRSSISSRSCAHAVRACPIPCSANSARKSEFILCPNEANTIRNISWERSDFAFSIGLGRLSCFECLLHFQSQLLLQFMLCSPESSFLSQGSDVAPHRFNQKKLHRTPMTWTIY